MGTTALIAVEYSYWKYHLTALAISVVLQYYYVLLVVVSPQRPYFSFHRGYIICKNAFFLFRV